MYVLISVFILWSPVGNLVKSGVATAWTRLWLTGSAASLFYCGFQCCDSDCFYRDCCYGDDYVSVFMVLHMGLQTFYMYCSSALCFHEHFNHWSIFTLKIYWKCKVKGNKGVESKPYMFQISFLYRETVHVCDKFTIMDVVLMHSDIFLEKIIFYLHLVVL